MDQTPVSAAERWRNRGQRLLKFVRRALPFALGVLATLFALLLYNQLAPHPHQLTLREVNDAVAQTLASATPPPAYSSIVYQIIRPSLVLIETNTSEAEKKDQKGLGSGVIIDNNGDILTSLHVVDKATDIQLFFYDGTQSSAQVVTTQPENDIAVLQAETLPGQVVPAVLGNPNAMNVGDDVYAVGNPFGLYSSMTAGVISGFDRTFKPVGSEQELKGLIQIDAAVNPGNSGGPLLNRYGQVVGIVEGILNPTDESFFVGIGFAVPINVAGGAAGLPPY
jgi:S1-C subfamily serine protease